jgi:putative ABC transport system substrate-binding protein
MKRREFITLLGGAAAAWPLAARAQQPTMPVIGFLHASSPEASPNLVAAFRKGMSESGYVEGANVTIEYRWAQNDNARLPELAADLVRRRVAVIATPGSGAAALAAKAATATIPIIFGMGLDPVQSGLVTSFNRPGGNVTGISYMQAELGAKQLGLLHEIAPGAARFAALVNPNDPTAESVIRNVQAGASAIGRHVEVFTASSNRDISRAFASIVQKRIDALVVSPDPLFGSHRVQLAVLAARHAIPAIYSDRQYAAAGGLMSYGTSLAEQYRQVGIYAGRALKGDRPADLPVMRATKFELIINLQTAEALGIQVPAVLLVRADEVIE